MQMLEMFDIGTTRAAYAFLDILSKSGYAYHGWYIRWNILRKYNKPEEFVDEIKDEDDQKEYKVRSGFPTNTLIDAGLHTLSTHMSCKSQSRLIDCIATSSGCKTSSRVTLGTKPRSLSKCLQRIRIDLPTRQASDPDYTIPNALDYRYRCC